MSGRAPVKSSIPGQQSRPSPRAPRTHRHVTHSTVLRFCQLAAAVRIPPAASPTADVAPGTAGLFADSARARYRNRRDSPLPIRRGLLGRRRSSGSPDRATCRPSASRRGDFR